ncbi:MAG TPA: thermonuclease family protein [Bacteroidales bacterium]|nr:thermonuclease family protein [Bacteroidales bacterium]
MFVACNYRNNSYEKGDKIKGRIIAVVDGDTYDILLKNKRKIRVRMEGIDAPEKGMSFYRAAKNHLARLCLLKTATVKITGRDKHERFLGFTYLDDGTELSHEMIKSGLAWHFKKYNSDADLSALEKEAKKSAVGLWSEKNPVAPWEIRKLRRNGNTSQKSSGINYHQGAKTDN